MKNLIILFLLVVTGYCHSQDIIIKTDGTEIKSVVVEITEQAIKYRTWDYQTGPLYNINLKDVFEIKYANGTKYFVGGKSPESKTDTIAKPVLQQSKIDDKKTIQTVQNYFLYDSLIKESRTNHDWGLFGVIAGPAFIITGAITLGIGTTESGNKQTIDVIVGGIVITCGIVETVLGGTMLVKSKEQKETAAKYKPVAYISFPHPVMVAQENYKGLGVGMRVTF